MSVIFLFLKDILYACKVRDKRLVKEPDKVAVLQKAVVPGVSLGKLGRLLRSQMEVRDFGRGSQRQAGRNCGSDIGRLQ